jgi:ABC-type proline/glycine betaine transport system ATPase subunit
MEKKKIFVDKTEVLWRLIKHEAIYLIGSRRMGKTLTLSMISAIFTLD